MPEKKLYDLAVDPEFRDLIPPLNEEELKLLEESLVADGCESPLTVWNGVIIDGHNRYAICRKHDIPFSIQEKNFETREEVMLWMLRNQLGRRNLNSYQRSNLALKLEPLKVITEEALTVLKEIRIPKDNHLVFVFQDGREAKRVWKDRSRAESWTEEMREQARLHNLKRRKGGNRE